MIFLILLNLLVFFQIDAQNIDLTGEWKGFAIQTDGVSWEFSANFSQNGEQITGGIYYIDDKNPKVFAIYKMKGKIIGNHQLEYIEYEIIKDNPRAYSSWCYVETILEIKVIGDSIFLVNPAASSWTKNSNDTKGIRCPDASMKFSKKYEAKKNTIVKIEENIQKNEKITVYAIQFKPSRADLQPESFPALEDLVNYLRSHPGVKLEIIGHTDVGKNPEYNDSLSQKRAEKVKEFLVNRGILSNRLVAKGMGSREPIADNDTPEGRAKNRRTEFRFLEVN